MQAVLLTLRDFGFGSLGLTAADFQADTVVQLGQPPRRIDLLTHIDGVQFDACWPRRESDAVDGVVLPFIGLDDFKANKMARRRLRDLADLEALQASPKT